MQEKQPDLIILGSSAEEVFKENAEENTLLSGAIFVLLCVILIFSTLAYGAVDAWAFGFISILTGAIAFFWCLKSFLDKRFYYHPSPLQIPLLGLIVIGMIQLLPLRNLMIPEELLSEPPVSTLSLNPYLTRFAVVHLVIYAIFFSAAYVFLNNHRRIKKIVTIVIVFSSFMAFFGILQWLANPQGIYGWRQTPHAIPFASFVNQHHFAAFMEMTIGLTLALLLGKATGKDKRLLLIIAIVLMGIAIILTGSRGGLLSLLGVLVFVYVANYLVRKKSFESDEAEENQAGFRRKLTFIGSGLALILMIGGMVLFLGGDSSLMRGIGATNQEDFSSGRIHFWSVAIQIFKDNPIFGAGLDAFGTAFPRYDTWNGTFRVEQAHNDYLQILADAGVSGFLCVAAFIYLLFRTGGKIIERAQGDYHRSLAIGSLAGCFGILIHSFFDFPLRTPSNAFYFLLFAVLATTSVRFPRHRLSKSP